MPWVVIPRTSLYRGSLNQGFTEPCRSIYRPVYVNCINSYFNLAITMYTGTVHCRVAGSYKRAIKSTKHRAELTAISHQPSAIKSRKQKAQRPSTTAKHQAHRPSTKHQPYQHRTQAPITHHPSPSTSKQAPITTYTCIPLFAFFRFLSIVFISVFLLLLLLVSQSRFELQKGSDCRIKTWTTGNR